MRLRTIWTLFRRVPAWWWIGVVSLGLTAALAVDLSPWLRGDLDWRWDYVPIYSWDRVLRVAACLAIYIAGAALAWRWGQVSERRAWLVVSAAVALAVALQWVGLTINNPDPLSTLMYRATSP